MEEFRRLYERSRPCRGRLLTGFACAALASLFEPALVWMVGLLTRELERAPELAAEGELWPRVGAFMVLFPLLALLKGVVTYGSEYLIAHSAQRILADLRTDLYRNLVDRPIAFLNRLATGELVSRVTNDVQRIELGLSRRLPDLVTNVPAAVLLAGYLWYLNWRLAFIVTIVLPVAVALVRRWARRIKRASREAQEHTAQLSSAVNETLGGVRVVKAYRAEAHEVSRFERLNDNLRRVNVRAYRTMAISSPILDALSGLVIAVLVGLAAREIVAGALELSTFLAFLTAMTQAYRALKKVTNANNELQNTTAAARRCFDLLDDPESEPSGRRTIDHLEHGIQFHRVSFSHPETPVLHDFELTLNKGEVVALVGESGAGKTTVANLLVRFNDVTDGSITWDGIDLREIAPKSLRGQVAMVTQDAVVFDDTVARNIAYADASPDPDRIVAAARAAHADEFVRELEHGYETRLGERGSRLSGGQRQRIAIARALYKDAPVLILDEATSALDAQSEALVQDALARLFRDRTVLVVAHRLATVRAADRIVVLSEGRIVQQGSHRELVDQDGTYRQLYRLQSDRA